MHNHHDTIIKACPLSTRSKLVINRCSNTVALTHIPDFQPYKWLCTTLYFSYAKQLQNAPWTWSLIKCTSTLNFMQDVVLVGGGHAHVAVLRNFGMHPLPGVRLTLVTPSAHTAYRHARHVLSASELPSLCNRGCGIGPAQWPHGIQAHPSIRLSQLCIAFLRV